MDRRIAPVKSWKRIPKSVKRFSDLMCDNAELRKSQTDVSLS
ncbi:hypothetical protein CES85_2118 [Ochrobactrum quorumnocens]|uniref:Uncharacterized protein n=1 Tax=Ochrobactrum quorumnocens TaxID=271865 RepID=A0A248UIW0_9HYPH|nr:hypothetical protein CES85_2118 [[Ochrobactrum] quorumnocens]